VIVLALLAVLAAAGGVVASTGSEGWSSPIVLGLLVAGAIALLGALLVFAVSGGTPGDLLRAVAAIFRVRAVAAAIRHWSPLLWRGFPSSRRRRRAATPTGPTPDVIAAMYGFSDRNADVKEAVRDLARTGRPFTVDNDTLVDGDDPAPNQVKTLMVVYRPPGEPSVKTATFTEGEEVHLS
jgi:hypothetical protein